MLEENDIFLDKQDIDRLRIVLQWDQMFHGIFHHVINLSVVGGEFKTIKVDPLVPIASLVSEIMGDLLFGEFPIFKFNNDAEQNKFDEWLKTQKSFEEDMLEAATYVSALGTLFARQFKINNKSIYDFISSGNVRWDEDVFGIIRFFIFHEFIPSDVKRSAAKFRWFHVEEHFYLSDDKRSPLLDEDRQYVIDNYDVKVDFINGQQIVKEVAHFEREETELKNMPITKISNIKQLSMKSGKSDYQGKEQLYAEIDNRVDQINYV